MTIENVNDTFSRVATMRDFCVVRALASGEMCDAQPLQLKDAAAPSSSATGEEEVGTSFYYTKLATPVCYDPKDSTYFEQWATVELPRFMPFKGTIEGSMNKSYAKNTGAGRAIDLLFINDCLEKGWKSGKE